MFKITLLLVAVLFVVPDGANFVKASDINAPPYNADLIIPEAQKKLHTDGFPIIKVLRELILEAIAQRNTYGAAVFLTGKFTPQLQHAITSWESHLKTLANDKCKKPEPEYYYNCATLVEEKILKKSDGMMAGVNNEVAKSKIDIDELVARVNRFFDNLTAAVENSPSGAYLDWENVTFDGVKATDEWTNIYNDLRVLGWDKVTRFMATNLVGNMRNHGDDRKCEIDPKDCNKGFKLPFTFGRK